MSYASIFSSSKLLSLFKRLTAGQYILCVNLLFYFSLWLVNASNKIIVAAFILLPILYFIRIKDSRISLVLAYIASSIIFSGKSYTIQLIPPGIFPIHLYPLGYTISLVVTPSFVISILIGLVLVKDLVLRKFRTVQIRGFDIAFLLYGFWLIVSDLFASNRPEISLPFRALALTSISTYCFIRIHSKKMFQYVPIFMWVFASIVLFESLISLQQLLAASPIYKTLESQVYIEYFGKAVDELEFRFRPLGTYDHANNFAGALTFFLLLLFVFMFQNNSIWIFVSFILGTITLILTLSRSAWIGYGFGMMVLLYFFEKAKKIALPRLFSQHAKSLIVVSIVLFLFFVFPRLEKSFYSFGLGGGGGNLRSLQTKDTLALILQYPILGVGTLMSVQETMKLNPVGIFSSVPLSIHNWYLLIAAEHGIPTLIFFSIFVLLSIRYLRSVSKTAQKRDPTFYLAPGLIAAVFATLIIGFFQPFMGETLIAMSIALVSGKSET